MTVRSVKTGGRMKGVKGVEIVLTVENKVGRLEEVSSAVKDKGINIRAINAWVEKNKAVFRLITSDNSNTEEVLKKTGKVKRNEVVIVEMPDEAGQLHSLALKLKEAQIDLNYIYGTASEPGRGSIIVFSSNDNDKALEVISK